MAAVLFIETFIKVFETKTETFEGLEVKTARPQPLYCIFSVISCYTVICWVVGTRYQLRA